MVGDIALEVAGLPRLKGTSAALAAEIAEVKLDKDEQRKHVEAVVRATPNASRDFNAITAPHRIPTHTYYESLSILFDSTLGKAQKVAHATEKLLRRVQGDIDTERPEQGQSSRRTHTQVFNVQGPNARVNVNSKDKSFNAAHVDKIELFSKLRVAADAIEPPDERQRVQNEVDLLAESHSSGNFLAGYQRFIGAVADHITVFGAFLPALSKLLGS